MKTPARRSVPASTHAHCVRAPSLTISLPSLSTPFAHALRPCRSTAIIDADRSITTQRRHTTRPPALKTGRAMAIVSMNNASNCNNNNLSTLNRRNCGPGLSGGRSNFQRNNEETFRTSGCLRKRYTASNTGSDKPASKPHMFANSSIILF